MIDSWRLLVTGSRRISPEGKRILREHLCTHLDLAVGLGRQLVVVQGQCESGGVDLEAARWGYEMRDAGQPVEVEGHPARNHPAQDFGPWPGCGPRRNRYMVSLGAHHCLALVYACISATCRRPEIHPSHGTVDCVRQAKAAGIPTTELDLWKL